MTEPITDPLGRVWHRRSRVTRDGRRIFYWETHHENGTDSAIDTPYLRRQIRNGNMTRTALGGPKYWKVDPE